MQVDAEGRIAADVLRERFRRRLEEEGREVPKNAQLQSLLDGCRMPVDILRLRFRT